MFNRRNWLQEIKEYGKQIIYAGVIVLIINAVFGLHIVLGDSMQPNFATGQFLVSLRIPFLADDLHFGEIIAFQSPENPDDLLIKRVIGLPGDTVEIRDTQVFVNGVLLDEPYINEPCSTNKCRNRIWQLDEHEYFVMGDNRNHSNDSRRFGPIPEDLISSRMLIRLWPLTDISMVEHIGLDEE